MKNYTKIGYATESFILLLYLILALTPYNSYSQDNPFVYMHDDKFYLGCGEFYPVAVNYGVMPVRDINGNFQISPLHDLCRYSELYLSIILTHIHVGLIQNEWEQELIDHFTND